MLRRSLLLVLMLPLLAVPGARAQVLPGGNPGVLQQLEMERERQRRDEELRRERIEQPIKPVPAKPAPTAPAPDDGLEVFVREIRFEPRSELLTSEELEPLVAPYRGRSVRISGLRDLVQKINDLYKSKGIVTAQASLPRQDITEGVVRIRLVEGRIGRIQLKGNESTNEDYITDRLRLKPSMLVDLGPLERDMVRFNRTNDAQLSAELHPGENVGDTDLAITVSEPKRNDLRLFADNAGSASTGELRGGASYLRRSLFGRRDDLYISSTTADGYWGNYVTYGAPLNTYGTRMTLGYFNDKTKIVHGAVAALNVSGEATTMNAQLRHPLILDRAHQFDLTMSAKKRRSVNWIDTQLLSASDLYAGSLGIDMQLSVPDGYWAGNIELSGGKNKPVDSVRQSYNLLRGSLRRSMSFDQERVTLIGAFSFQATEDQLLPSGEQFVIGGEGSVRGYSTALYTGDNGMLLNLEAHRRVIPAEKSNLQGSFFGFFDYGEVRPFRPPGNPRSVDTLASMGGGFSFAYARSVTGKIVFGAPLYPRPEEPRSFRIHFQLAWYLL